MSKEYTLSEKNKQKLRDLGVGIVYLFGSRAIGAALGKSDYDIGVVFDDVKKLQDDSAKLYLAVYNILSEEFPEQLDGPKIDISFLQKANAALELSAIRYGKILFEANPKFRADYEEGVIFRYDDFRFLQKKYEEVTFTAFTHR